MSRDDSKDERLFSDSVVRWSARIGRHVPVICGSCKVERICDYSNIDRRCKDTYTGLCFKCSRPRPIKYFGDQQLRSGSTIHWNERNPLDPRERGVTCGLCSTRRLTIVPAGARIEGWSGFCRKCVGISSRRRGDERRPRGTIIHWDERDPKAPYERVAITCRRCSLKSYTSIKNFAYPNWSELCSGCIQQCGSPKRRTGDQKLPTGSIIKWDVRDPNNPRMIGVICGWKGCGRERKADLSAIKRKNFTGYCREHVGEISGRALSAA